MNRNGLINHFRPWRNNPLQSTAAPTHWDVSYTRSTDAAYTVFDEATAGKHYLSCLLEWLSLMSFRKKSTVVCPTLWMMIDKLWEELLRFGLGSNWKCIADEAHWQHILFHNAYERSRKFRRNWFLWVNDPPQLGKPSKHSLTHQPLIQESYLGELLRY